MNAPRGISREGREAERLFCQLTGAVLCARAALGDVVLDGEHLVEIKTASSNTVNQVRAVKYLTLAVYAPPTGSWLIVPADEIVRIASTRTRGQHTENPFECMTLSVRGLKEFQVPADDLRAATLSAIARSEARPDMREAMERVRAECRRSADDALEQVRALL